jgi:signal transduction histidine kinase
MRSLLNTKREEKLQRAREAASSLLGWMLATLLLSIGVTSWVVYLFYRGLIHPLVNLKEATSRIRSGELSHRIAAPDAGVTELQELSHSFNGMAEKLEQLDRAKTEFLATISHEIKNPLAALKEGLNLLATQGEHLSPESRSKAFAACLIASKRMEFMINNMLHHSKVGKMEHGLYQFGLTLKNLTAALQTAVDEVRPLADRKKMAIQLRAPAELEASFNWDGMVQVFENLLLNAIKYGSESSSIEVTAQPAERPLKSGSRQAVPHVEISFANLGARIAESEIPKLFDPYYRGRNSDKNAGLGLGLHVVRRIIDAHHGEVRASSTPITTCASAREDTAQTRIQLWIPSKYQSEIGANMKEVTA